MTFRLTTLSRPQSVRRFLVAFLAAVLLLLLIGKRTDGGTMCSGGKVNVVAHPDDDLLFISPDLLQDVRAGGCVTTIYLTAGDAGREAEYWGARENGVRAAYAKMYTAANEWRNDALFVNGHVIPSSTLAARPSIRLVFVRLPDGGFDGRGFRRGGLQQLWSGAASSLASVDSTSFYSREDLVLTLRALLQSASPQIVRAMDFRPAPYGFGSGDHSDHVAAAYLTEAALGAGNPALKGYLGYLAVVAGPANVKDPLLQAKRTLSWLARGMTPPSPARASVNAGITGPAVATPIAAAAIPHSIVVRRVLRVETLGRWKPPRASRPCGSALGARRRRKSHSVRDSGYRAGALSQISRVMSQICGRRRQQLSSKESIRFE